MSLPSSPPPRYEDLEPIQYDDLPPSYTQASGDLYPPGTTGDNYGYHGVDELPPPAGFTRRPPPAYYPEPAQPTDSNALAVPAVAHLLGRGPRRVGPSHSDSDDSSSTCSTTTSTDATHHGTPLSPFDDAATRCEFIKWVFAILTVQWIIVFGAALPFALVPVLRDWVQESDFFVGSIGQLFLFHLFAVPCVMSTVDIRTRPIIRWIVIVLCTWSIGCLFAAISGKIGTLAIADLVITIALTCLTVSAFAILPSSKNIYLRICLAGILFMVMVEGFWSVVTYGLYSLAIEEWSLVYPSEHKSIAVIGAFYIVLFIGHGLDRVLTGACGTLKPGDHVTTAFVIMNELWYSPVFVLMYLILGLIEVCKRLKQVHHS